MTMGKWNQATSQNAWLWLKSYMVSLVHTKKLLCAYVNSTEFLEQWIIFSNWSIFLQVDNKALVLSFMIVLQYVYFRFNSDVFDHIYIAIV